MKLNESKDIFVYEDTSTNIRYVYDGNKLIPIYNPNNRPANDFDLSDYDKDSLAKEDEERQKQIEQEIDDYDPDAEDAEARLKDISDLFADADIARELTRETEDKVFQDRSKRAKEKKAAEKEANTYSANKGIAEFVLDLNRLIKREVAKVKSSSWGRINKKADGTGVMKPGRVSKKNPNIPRLAVYFDQSGSWNEADIAVGMQAIETLNTYVKKKQLVIELYYFANTVHTNAMDARNEGGTGAGKLLIDHIRATKADNVVIMTDDDFDSWGEIFNANKTTVPGGVFLLFRRNSVSKGLVDKLHGKLLTKIYTF